LTGSAGTGGGASLPGNGSSFTGTTIKEFSHF